MPTPESLPLDEHTLIALAKKGGTEGMEALGMLLEQYRDALTAHAYYTMRDKHLAEDVVQELFANLIQRGSIRQFRSDAKFSSWLYTALDRLMIDWFRRTRSRPQLVSQTAFEASFNIFAGWNTDLDPREMMEQEEDAEAIQRVIRTLRYKLRIVAEAVIVQELSYEEAAAALNIAVGTVKSRMHLAKQQLRAMLSPCKAAA